MKFLRLFLLAAVMAAQACGLGAVITGDLLESLSGFGTGSFGFLAPSVTAPITWTANGLFAELSHGTSTLTQVEFEKKCGAWAASRHLRPVEPPSWSRE